MSLEDHDFCSLELKRIGWAGRVEKRLFFPQWWATSSDWMVASSYLAKAQRQMTKDGFLMYLLSADGNAFSLAHRRVYQDMDQPLSHYLVSSSHNTYLLEDQLTGPSSTEAYIRCGPGNCWGQVGVGPGPGLGREGPSLIVTTLQGSVQRLPVFGAGLLGWSQPGAHHLPWLHFYL